MSDEFQIEIEGQPSCQRAVDSDYSIGRSAGNALRLADPRVSRNHALIRRLGHGRLYLVDLGSSNGTFLNGRPVFAPTLLKKGDEIQIANCRVRCLSLDADNQPPGHDPGQTTMHTALDFVQETIALLVVDIRDFTALTERVPAARLSQLLGSWFKESAAIVEDRGGVIDKFIGDALMAYWIRSRGVDARALAVGPLQVARELVKLARAYHERLAAERRGLGFAVGCGVHIGEAMFGTIGQSARRDLTAIGDCVNVAFRIESLCKELKHPILVSQEAVNAASGVCEFEDLGLQRLKGKTEKIQVFAVRDG